MSQLKFMPALEEEKNNKNGCKKFLPAHGYKVFRHKLANDSIPKSICNQRRRKRFKRAKHLNEFNGVCICSLSLCITLVYLFYIHPAHTERRGAGLFVVC